MNMTHFQSILAPWLAPIAPAVLFGNNLHAGMIADQVNPVLAAAAAVLGTVGVELSGALACTMAVMAYHRRDYKIMLVSIGAAFVYAVFVMVGILQAVNTAAFAGAVVISLVAYLMQGVWQSYSQKLVTAQVETGLQVSVLDAERKLANAQARRAKSENGNFPKVSESYQSHTWTDWRRVPAAERAKIAGMTSAQVSQEYQVSERTALNWLLNSRRES